MTKPYNPIAELEKWRTAADRRHYAIYSVYTPLKAPWSVVLHTPDRVVSKPGKTLVKAVKNALKGYEANEATSWLT